MTLDHLLWLSIAMGLALSSPVEARAQAVGHVTGIGGVFVRSKDPKALAAWYRDALGVTLQPWGGVIFHDDGPGRPPAVAWTAFPQSTGYMAPSTREFMIDLVVDDLDAVLLRLQARGVPILKRDDSDPTGSFAWILDPDGTKIELWQPHPK